MLVPVNDDTLYIDLFAAWALPVILVARTTLGTINHSLLSLEALRARSIDVAGVIFSGEENTASEAAIVRFGRCRHLGRLPRLDPLTATTLAEARKQGAVFAYGSFITVVLNFLILAWIIFLMVKSVNNMRRRLEGEKPAPDAAPPPEDVALLTEIRDLLAARK